MVTFSCLYREPDLPSRIFSLLSAEDLCHVELVCQDWRDIVVNENLWRRKMKKKQACLSSWQCFLGQIQWNSDHSKHLTSKRLFIDISIKLGPDHMTPAVLERILESNLEKPLSKATTLLEKAWLKKTQDDFDILVSNAPQGGFQLPQNVGMGKLVVFGSAAFPILVTGSGCVVMAGAHYGKGRLVVVAHEALLSDLALIRGASDWCGRQKDCSIVCDPKTKVWNGVSWEYTEAGRWCPKNSIFLPRDQVSSNVSVYLTQGHYEDHADHLVEYVRQGGGLIVGGHAWWWSHIRNNRLWPWELVDSGVCSLLEHPGNMIVNRMGIVFSRVARVAEVEEEDNIVCTTCVPGLKNSLRSALICLCENLEHNDENGVLRNILEKNHSDVLEEFYGFDKRGTMGQTGSKFMNVEYLKEINGYIRNLISKKVLP